MINKHEKIRVGAYWEDIGIPEWKFPGWLNNCGEGGRSLCEERRDLLLLCLHTPIVVPWQPPLHAAISGIYQRNGQLQRNNGHLDAFFRPLEVNCGLCTTVPELSSSSHSMCAVSSEGQPPLPQQRESWELPGYKRHSTRTAGTSALTWGHSLFHSAHWETPRSHQPLASMFPLILSSFFFTQRIAASHSDSVQLTH